METIDNIYWIKAILEFDQKAINHFYSIRIDKDKVTLQGNLNKTYKMYFEDLGFVFTLDNNHNWIEGQKDNVCITFTF